MKHFDIKCFSFRKGLLMVLLVAIQTVLAAQVTLSLQYKEKNNITTMQAGATASMQLDYSVSSTTGNASGVKIVVTMPDHVYDIPTRVGTAHAPATNFVFDGTPGAKKLTITFIDPVPSGSTGVLEFGMRCNNFTVPNNTVVTTTATLTATGGYTSGPKTNNITLTAIPRICAQKVLLNGGALNNNTTYRITVSTDGSYSLFDALLGTLVPTNIVLKDSLPAGATFVSANVYRLDGNVLVGTGTVSGNVVTANIPNITMYAISHYGTWQANPYYVDITVNYPTPTFSSGSSVTNRAMITYTPHGGSATNLHNGFTVGTCTSDLIETHTLSNTSISVDLTKSAYPSGNYYPSQEFTYSIGFANNSNVSLNNVEIIDSFPANIRLAPNNVRGVRWDDWSKLNRIEYQTNTTGNTWYVAPAATGYHDLVPAFPSGQYITKIKFVLVSPFPANTSLSGYNQLTFTSVNEPIAVQNISNCVKWNSSTAGIPIESARTFCNNSITLNPRPSTSKTYYYIRQTPSCQGGIILGQNLTFTGTCVADIGFSNVQNPVCAMLVPRGFQFVSQSFTVGTSGLPTAPTLQIIPNYITIGGVVKDLYRWTFPNGTVLPYGKSFDVSATVQVTGALSGGVAYTVDFMATGSNTSINQSEYDYGSITDTGDWDLDGNTTETFPRANSDYYGYTCYVTATASMESIKWVKGQVDNQYTRYPETGTTVPGGNADYRLVVKNTGNVPMRNIQVIDILPYLSDEGVIDLSARQTQWRPNLAGTITAPSGGTIYYSTTGNPCRDEMKPPAASSPFPTGCVAPNWSTTPPPDITKVQSIKIDFGATVLNPSDSLVFTWPMRAPVTAPTNNEIAWNSFGFVATRTDNNQPLLAAEPIKVGIKVQQPSPAIYGNRVWFDTNQNGVQDAGENGVDGIMVRLYRALGGSPAPATDPLVNFTVTGNGGLYSFPNLPAGNYYAIFHGISQYQLSPANAGSDDAIDSDGTTTVYSGQSAAITSITSLVTGEEDYSWDLGIYCSFTPTLTSNSPVISGNTITLTASGGTTYMWSGPDGFTATGATVTIPNAAASHAGVYTVNVTNAGGCYASMTTNVIVATGPPVSLCPGDEYTLSVPSGSVGQWYYNGIPIPGATNITYIVKHTAPGVYHFAGTDAQGCSFTSCTSGVFVTGTCPTGSVGNYVWTDTNADGINNEPASAGINGVTVQLWSATGDTLIATTTTANDGSGNPGYYNFVVDRNGSYYIKFPTTNGINILTTQTTTAATDNNSDANTSTGKSPNFTITVTGTGVAKDNPTIDAGYRVPPTTVNVTVDNATVCIGGSATLTATPTGGNGTYTYQWQSSSDNITFANISGAMSATYTAPTTTAGVIFYRAVVTSGGLSANSNSTSVTVIADPSVTVASSNGTTICTGGTTTLTATVTGGSGTITYAWESSANGTTWTPVGTNLNTYTTPALTATTYYRVTIAQSVNGCSVVSTNTIVNVVADPTVTLTASATNVCIGGVATLTATPSGGTGTPTYQWQSSSDNVTFNNISGANSSTYSVPTTATSALFYRVNVTYSGAGCGTGTSTGTQINVVADPSVSITAGSTICTGGTATLTATVSGGTGTTLYQWQSSSDNVTFTDISGATNASYTTPALTSNMYYRVNVTQNSGCAVSSSSSMITVTADPTVTLTASAANVCIGGVATLTATPSGGTGTPTYQWQSSIDNITFANISGANSSTYSVPTTATSALFYRVNVTYSGAGCGTGTSTGTQINVVADPSVSITAGSTICTGGTATLNATVSGGTGTTLYQWQSSSDNVTFTDISGATNASYTTPALTSNMYYRVNVTQNSGCAVSSSSSMITVTADPTVTVTASATNVCIGGVATLTATPSGGTGTPTYQWQSSIDNITFANISGANSSTYSVPTTATSALFYRVNVTYSGAGCGTGTSTGTQINVVADPSVSITAGSTICTGGTATLTATVSGGTGTTLYQWQSSSDNVTFTDISGATNASYTTPALTSNMYYRVNVTQNSGCAVSSSSSMITVTADPTVTVTASAANVCIGGVATLTATPSGGTGTPTYQWQSSIDNITFANISGANSSTYSVPTTATSALFYRVNVTYSGAGCGTGTSTGTQINVVADPSVSITAGSTICTGGTATLTATVSGGTGTTLYQWQSSSDNVTFTDISGATNASYTTPALTSNMYYRVNVTQNSGCAVSSSSSMITIVPTPTVNVSASATNVCIGGVATLTATPSGGTGTPTYQWQSSSDNVTFNNISGANSSTYSVPTTATSALFYRVNVTYSGAGCGTGTSTGTQINVVADPSVSITAGSTICTGGTATLNATVSGGTGTTLYQWQSSSDNVTFTDISGATNASYTTPALTSNMYYRVNVTQNSGCAVSSSSSMITVTADPTVTVTASAANVCIGGVATLTATPSGGTGTPTYQWQSSSDNVTFNNISGANSSTYSVPTTSTSALFYRVNVTYSGAGCGTGTSTGTQINVVADPSVSITAGSTICTGGTATLNATVSGGTGTTLYQWQSSSDNVTFTDISGATNASYTTPALTSNMYYRVNVTQNSGCAISSSSSMITVTADPTVNVTASAANVCIGGVATLTATPSGGTGTPTYQWQSSIDNITFANISGANSSTYSVPTTATSALFYRVNVTYSGAGCGTGTSTGTQINVVADPSVTITAGSTICTGGTATLTATVSGGTGTTLYQWQSSSDNVTFTDISGATNASYTTPALTSNMYYRVNVTQNSGCAVSSSSSMITVTADPTVTVTASATNVCIGGVATLTATPSGGTGTPTYQWQSSSDNVTFNNISGANSSTYSVPTTSTSALFYRVNVTYSGAGCGTGTSTGTQINVVADPSVSITAGSTICTGGTATLNATVSGGTGTILYQWQSSSDNVTFTDISGATNASYTTPALTSNMYYRVNVTQNSGCAVSSSSSMITVVADPSVTVSGGTTICANNTVTLTANVINGTGATTYQWQSSSDNVTFANISGAINATYTTPALTSTTYYRVVINQAVSGCGTATSANASVIVNPSIAITTQPTNITQCIGGTQALSIVATGIGLTYQWQSSSNNSTWTNIVGQIGTSYTPPSTTAGTMYYRVVVSGTPCTAVNSSSATVVTNSLLSLGDYVWLDINNNGLQDVGELGIGNVTVKLYADANNDNIPDGAALATTTTNNAGAYTFNNLCNGRYVVSIVVPASYIASTTTATSSDPNNATANDNNGIATFNTTELRSNSINLIATNLNVDFGLRGTLNLGNLVWFDNNNNGTRDVGENGVSAVTVQLYQDANNDNTPDGVAIATTTTDGSGIYAFSNLPNGNYIVGIALPTGYVSTTTTANSATPNSDTDNDNNGVTVVSGELRSNAITLSAGTEPTTDGDGNNGNLTLDFGVRGALNLGNRVWSDANNNGLLDVGETGIANVQVYLFRDDNGDGVPENSGNPIANTTTDASGNYSFTGLIPGGYMVGIGMPANYIVATVPASGTNPDNNTDNDNNLSRLTGGYNTTGTIFLTAGGEPTTDGDGNNGNLTVDLGLYYPFNACLTSLIIDDFSTNANIINGISRPSPTNISGSYINAGSMGGVMTTTLTGLRTTGNTMLGAITGSGYYEISSAAGDSLGNVMTWDGDNNPALNPTGMTCKNLSPYLTLDFVYRDDRPAGSTVNFEVTLYSNTNNASKVNFNYTTGGNGHYGVVSIPLAGLRALSGMSAVDLSCVKAIQLKTDMAGANNNGWDYSIGQIIACAKTLPASVGDYTWNDLNGNGIQEPGEPAMSGVTVTLKDNNGTDITSTTTNASGNYLFTNLSPGTYQVVFTTPSGFNTSPALQGGNTATDSDPVGGIATVTLAAGQNNLTIDAGFVLPCVAANITTQPTTFSECIGGTQSLSVVASGTPLTYQWQSSTNNSTWTNIAGATTTTYTPPSTTAGVTYYRVVVTAGACGSVNSNSATVTIVADPSVTVTATAPNVCNGGSVTISANLTGGTGCSYQWQSSPDGTTWTNIPSATGATYVTPALNSTTRYRVNLNCTGSGCCN